MKSSLNDVMQINKFCTTYIIISVVFSLGLHFTTYVGAEQTVEYIGVNAQNVIVYTYYTN